jgi:hypothetical protein
MHDGYYAISATIVKKGYSLDSVSKSVRSDHNLLRYLL